MEDILHTIELEKAYNPKDFDIEVAKRDALSEICYV